MVIYYTEKTYKEFKQKINPNNLSRTFGKYHVDHIISKIWGFKHQIDPIIIAHWMNLQMLSHSENCSKQGELFISQQEAFKKIQEIKNKINLNNKKE